MSLQSVTYEINLRNNVIQALEQTEAVALRFDNTMRNVNETLRFFGLGFAGHFVVDEAKKWVDGAAEYEQAMLRIKNASVNATDGIKNQLFINSEVDKFKIDLQTAADAYGEFLVKIRNANLPADQVRKLHDEVLLISKVTAAPQGKMDSAVRDIGIMLGEGVLEARHLRALSYVMPQIIPFVAQQFGMSSQELSSLISSGKLTKSSIDSRVILSAMEEYANTLKNKLPESLQTTRSELNQLDNEWLRFKNDLVTELKPELIDLIHDLESIIHYLSEHREGVIATGKVILKLAEGYIAYRTALFSINAVNGLWNLAIGYQNVENTKAVGIIDLKTAAIVRLTEAIEALNVAQTEAAASSAILYDAQGVPIWTGAANVAALTASQAESSALAMAGGIGARASGALAGISGAFVQGALAVFITGFTIDALNDMYHFLPQSNEFGEKITSKDLIPFQSNQLKYLRVQKEQEAHDYIQDLINQNVGYSFTQQLLYGKKAGGLSPTGNDLYSILVKDQDSLNRSNFAGLDMIGKFLPKDMYGHIGDSSNAALYSTFQKFGFKLPYLQEETTGAIGRGSDGKPTIPKLNPNHIRGNSVTNIHIEIHEMNGIKQSTFKITGNSEEDAKKYSSMIGVAVVKTLTDAVNDSQHIADHRQ